MIRMDLDNIKVKRVFDDGYHVTFAYAELETGERLLFFGQIDPSYIRKKWEWNKLQIFDAVCENAKFVWPELPTKEHYDDYPYKEYIEIYNEECGYYKIKDDVLMKIVKAIKEHCDNPNDDIIKFVFEDCPELYANDIRSRDDYDPHCEMPPSSFFDGTDDDYSDEYGGEYDRNTNENDSSDKSEEVSNREMVDIDELSETKSAKSTNSEEGYACMGQDKPSVVLK